MLELVGQQLGNYRLIQSLGRGGYAEVYLGEHVRLNTQAAIKVLHARLASSEEVDRFQEEGRILASLVHPHIVRVFDFDVVQDTPFMVMEYAPNGSLRRRHPKGERLALSTILPYVRQVADALQYAHDQHFIHRDIKPENMLLGRNDEVLLSDFGTALVAQSTGYQNALEDIVGTVAYMAPEQFQGKSRPASDQYSLAVIVYEWLTGELPFRGSGTEVAIQHSVAPVPSLRGKAPEISPPVEQIVMKALSKDYHERFVRVQDFAEALEQASLIDTSFYTEPTLASVVTPAAPLTPPAAPPLVSEPEPSVLPSPAPVITPQELKPSPLMMDTATTEVAHAPHASASVTPSPVQRPELVPPTMAVPPAPVLPAPAVQPVQQSEPFYYEEPVYQRKRRPWLAILLLLAALMFIGSGIIWYIFILPRLGTLNQLGGSTTQTAQYPSIAGTYSGSLDNTTAQITTSMGLAIQQNQGAIHGQFTVGPALVGSGPFTGTIDTSKHMRFTVQAYKENAPLLFIGSVQSDGSLNGTYCSTGSNGQCDANAGAGGTWHVARKTGDTSTTTTVYTPPTAISTSGEHHKKKKDD